MTDLVARPRGNYSVPVNDGAGPLNGSNVFVRKFDAPPIQQRVADRIELLEAGLRLAITYIELAYSEEGGEEAAEAKHDLDRCRALLPEGEHP